MTPEEIIELQKETLDTVKEYLGNLIPGMKNVVTELEGDMKDDTWEYLRMILDGFNWVTEAFNGIVDYIDKDGSIFNIKDVDESVKKLSDAYSIKDAVGIAASIKNEIIPFLEKINSVEI